MKEENEGTDQGCRIGSNGVLQGEATVGLQTVYLIEKNYPRGNTVNGRMNEGMNVGPVKEGNEWFF